jgi:hypothetical protein
VREAVRELVLQTELPGAPDSELAKRRPDPKSGSADSRARPAFIISHALPIVDSREHLNQLGQIDRAHAVLVNSLSFLLASSTNIGVDHFSGGR